jgi:ATP-dependent helicase/nuclease subunit A
MSCFTPNQEKAIAARGNVLVVAGAGTGKTRTLVQRCLQWLLEAPGDHSLEQVLMVTFTDAAAAEMRHRIREELKNELTRTPDNWRLVEQLALLETAFISTLHSFCYRLVREHFYELDLDPNLGSARRRKRGCSLTKPSLQSWKRITQEMAHRPKRSNV